MMRYSDVHTLIRSIPQSIPKHLQDEDIARVHEGWFGPRFCAWSPISTALYLGGRSGLEVMIHRFVQPTVPVYIIEKDPLFRQLLDGHFSDDSFVKIYPNVEIFLRENNIEGKLGFVRVDGPYYDCIDQFINRFEIDAFTLELPARESIFEFSEKWRPHLSYLYCAHPNEKNRAIEGRHTGPAVSVVVPAYNVADELSKCLESLISQSLESFEIIVVDDGSPDDSGQVADDFSNNYPGRIRVIHKKNGGCASARNAGILEAKGKYIGFVDGDDWVASNMYEKLYRLAVNTGAEISQGSYRLAYSGGVLKDDNDIYVGDGPLGREGIVRDVAALLAGKPTIWRRIYSRNFLMNNDIVFPEHIKRFDDLPFQFEALANAKLVATTADIFYYYRQGREGQDIAVRDRRLFVHFDIFDYLKPRVISYMPKKIVMKLFEVELNTHLWALSRLEHDLIDEYCEKAIYSLAAGYGLLSLDCKMQIAVHKGDDAVRLINQR